MIYPLPADFLWRRDIFFNSEADLAAGRQVLFSRADATAKYFTALQ